MWGESISPDMQSFKCTLAEGGVGQITDVRDGNTYKIAKLKDGKCWMTENLRLGDSKLKNRTLTPENTNISSNYTMPTSNLNGFSQTLGSSFYIDSNMNYGGYYTWLVATARTGEPISNTEGQIASGSICPKGWRLPTRDEFTILARAYGGNNSAGSTALQTSSAGFIYSGQCSYGKQENQGSTGGWWSSSSSSSPRAWRFLVSNLQTYVVDNGTNYGFSVRCISDVI